MNVCLLLVPEQRVKKRVDNVRVGHLNRTREQRVEELGDVALATVGDLADLLAA